MKTASFKAYLEKRLNKEEIQEIKQQVDSEFEALKMPTRRYFLCVS